MASTIRCDDMDIMGVAVAHKDAIRQCVSEQNKRPIDFPFWF